MNRPVAVSVASIEAVNAAQATVIQEKNERRGIAGGLPFAGAAAGLAGAGLGGAAAVVAAPSRDSSLLIGNFLFCRALYKRPRGHRPLLQCMSRSINSVCY